MTAREQYAPGPASGARVQKDGENWTLVVVRGLRHAPDSETTVTRAEAPRLLEYNWKQFAAEDGRAE
jgi:hypothetical protein